MPARFERVPLGANRFRLIEKMDDADFNWSAIFVHPPAEFVERRFSRQYRRGFHEFQGNGITKKFPQIIRIQRKSEIEAGAYRARDYQVPF